eukprot:TRINITY_DN36616_c0_g2_i1.p1 TRINITY_DN36616_c0_g2~~TRINITY_DN36616_c0_g2_i1.p1  ORF type:complete len:525 (+),score=58.73 TRINITY_DN36616_c0_g2_i1:42-1577(+)
MPATSFNSWTGENGVEQDSSRFRDEESPECYAMLVGPDEATLGFGVSLAFNNCVLVNARSPFEFLSWDAFVGVPVSGQEDGDGKNEAGLATETSGWECAICTSLNAVSAVVCEVCHAASPDHDVRLHCCPTPSRLGVRLNSCSTERFTHFLPLYLSDKHYRGDLVARCLQAAWCRTPVVAAVSHENIDPGRVSEAVWHILPALMNSTAVALVGGELHTSDVALRGYFNLHRLLLEVATPELQARANAAAEGFAEFPAQRLKAHCTNLGQFLPRLLLLENPMKAWARIQDVLLEETLDRTVLHAYRDFPDLAQEVEGARYAQKRWESAAKGLRLLLFSVRFLRRAAKWGSSTEIKANYDRCFGQAGPAERDAFRQEVTAIRVVDSWEEFARKWREMVDPPSPHGGDSTISDEGLRRRCGNESSVSDSAAVGNGRELVEMSLAFRLGESGLPATLAALRESEQNSIDKGYHALEQTRNFLSSRRTLAPLPSQGRNAPAVSRSRLFGCCCHRRG